MNVTCQIDEPFVDVVDPEKIEQAVKTTLTLRTGQQAEAGGSVAVWVTDAATIQQLNQQYRGIDTPTDVLSFANTPDPDFPAFDPTSEPHLGDIIIAYPVAEAQATAGGHSSMEEIALLAVHGTLHLLNFDHDTAENKNTMWAAQQQIMAHLGLAHVQPTE